MGASDQFARDRLSFADFPGVPAAPLSSQRLLGRIVVALIVGAVAVVGASAWAVSVVLAPEQAAAPIITLNIGPVEFLVSEQQPPIILIALGLIGIGVVATFAVFFEVAAAVMSVNPKRRYLAEIRRANRPPTIDQSASRVTVLIPAHNEEAVLAATLVGLAQQSRHPDRVIVVADNCSDGTADIARGSGHEVWDTAGNRQRKGGALNQALARLLPVTLPDDLILIMDADTLLGPCFVETAAAQLEADDDLSAVGGLFYGNEGHGILGQFQRNEFTRYSLQIRQRRGRVFVLTGTSTMFRAEALLDVAAARGVFIPGEPGCVYDTAALTEDNELTLALKSLGATMTSLPACHVETEIMPSWRALWRQRQRWQRGALENIAAYGLTRATARYFGQQVGIGYGTVALNSSFMLLAITLLALNVWIWFPFWLALGAVFWLERVVTAWPGGWRARFLAAALVPELLYDVFQQVVFVSCLWDISTGRRAHWGHQPPPSGASA